MLAQGYAPTKHTVQFTAKTELKHITAVRLELLTDPVCRLAGPAARSMGPARSPSSRGRRDCRERRKLSRSSKSPARRRILESTRRSSRKSSTTRAAISRVTGPIEFAIDGSDDTAWGIDAGPGLRNQPRKAVFNFDKPIDP